jgi:hypothetical protein
MKRPQNSTSGGLGIIALKLYELFGSLKDVYLPNAWVEFIKIYNTITIGDIWVLLGYLLIGSGLIYHNENTHKITKADAMAYFKKKGWLKNVTGK